jgi:hypothetical protein
VTADARPCNRSIIPGTGGHRHGPSIESVAYQLAMRGDSIAAHAQWDVDTWPDRVHFAATIARQPEQAAS